MSILIEIVIPAVIILIANVFSHDYGSRRYEQVTAIFGYTSVLFLMIWLGAHILSFFLAIGHVQVQLLGNIIPITFQIFALSFVTALSRDYEKILKPNASFFEEKIKLSYKFLKQKLQRK